ncbi:MAG: class III signal peptide-containing protein [Candidatus Aceula lacicola]|nr:class III signal peptide-containing protein [Candidatus Aceula lacicola]
MRLRNKKGQSTLEYIILVTAIVAVMIIFLSPGGKLQTVVEDSYNTVADEVTDAAGALAGNFN